jgi:hypothetical protein
VAPTHRSIRKSLREHHLAPRAELVGPSGLYAEGARIVEPMAELIAGWGGVKKDNISTIGGSVDGISPAGFVHALPVGRDTALCGHFIYYRETSTPWSLVTSSPEACPRCGALAIAAG